MIQKRGNTICIYIINVWWDKYTKKNSGFYFVAFFVYDYWNTT